MATGAAIAAARTFLAKEGSANRASTGNVCVSNHCKRGRSIPVPLKAYCSCLQACRTPPSREAIAVDHTRHGQGKRDGPGAPREIEGSTCVAGGDIIVVVVHAECGLRALHASCPYPAMLHSAGSPQFYTQLLYTYFRYAARLLTSDETPKNNPYSTLNSSSFLLKTWVRLNGVRILTWCNRHSYY